MNPKIPVILVGEAALVPLDIEVTAAHILAARDRYICALVDMQDQCATGSRHAEQEIFAAWLRDDTAAVLDAADWLRAFAVVEGEAHARIFELKYQEGGTC